MYIYISYTIILYIYLGWREGVSLSKDMYLGKG